MEDEKNYVEEVLGLYKDEIQEIDVESVFPKLKIELENENIDNEYFKEVINGYINKDTEKYLKHHNELLDCFVDRQAFENTIQYISKYNNLENS